MVGLDTHAARVADLNAGCSHVDDISDAALNAAVAAGYTASIAEPVLAGAAVIVMCVSTPLGDDGGRTCAACRGRQRRSGLRCAPAS